MRKILLSLVALAGVSATAAHAAPVAMHPDVPAVAATSGVQRVDYDDWRRREWRRREAEAEWRRREEWRRWHRHHEWREREFGEYRRY